MDAIEILSCVVLGLNVIAHTYGVFAEKGRTKGVCLMAAFGWGLALMYAIRLFKIN